MTQSQSVFIRNQVCKTIKKTKVIGKFNLYSLTRPQLTRSTTAMLAILNIFLGHVTKYLFSNFTLLTSEKCQNFWERRNEPCRRVYKYWPWTWQLMLGPLWKHRCTLIHIVYLKIIFWRCANCCHVDSRRFSCFHSMHSLRINSDNNKRTTASVSSFNLCSIHTWTHGWRVATTNNANIIH